MLFAPFHDKFPELAKKEFRSVTIMNHQELPIDSYGLLESYCNDDGCDCRRVMFNVISEKHAKPLAVIAFGWETDKFYAKSDDIRVVVRTL